MRGKQNIRETVLAIILAVAGVLAFAGALRLVALGYHAIQDRVQQAEADRILGAALTPSPVRTAVGAVRTQIHALQSNDDPVPNAGLATLYNFLEPAIRHNLGSFTEYQDAMIGSIYGDLFTKGTVRFGAMRVDGDQAQQPVIVTLPPDHQALYIFTLARHHDGVYAGCWLTHNVVRFRQQPIPSGPRVRAGEREP